MLLFVMATSLQNGAVIRTQILVIEVLSITVLVASRCGPPI